MLKTMNKKHFIRKLVTCNSNDKETVHKKTVNKKTLIKKTVNEKTVNKKTIHKKRRKLCGGGGITRNSNDKENSG